jgi:SWI/SNF-related matrix-associated actin-dependent regulator 1 of chromatin subfamily A
MGDEDKDDSVVSFQEKKEIKVFCGMMIASGVGITLTKSSNLIKLGFSWSPADEEQAEDRIHRATTIADKVTITTLYCPDTIDEDIMELLNEKSQVVTKVLDNKNHTKKIIQADKSIFQTLIKRLTEKNNFEIFFFFLIFIRK